MAITATPYAVFMKNLFTGSFNLPSDTVKAALLKNTYTPNITTDAIFSDISTNEMTGAGYTAGGATLANIAVNYSSGSAVVSADAVNWSGLTGTFRYAAVYRVGGSSASTFLIGLIDFGADRVYSNEAFQLSFPANLITLAPVS